MPRYSQSSWPRWARTGQRLGPGLGHHIEWRVDSLPRPRAGCYCHRDCRSGHFWIVHYQSCVLWDPKHMKPWEPAAPDRILKQLQNLIPWKWGKDPFDHVKIYRREWGQHFEMSTRRKSLAVPSVAALAPSGPTRRSPSHGPPLCKLIMESPGRCS